MAGRERRSDPTVMARTLLLFVLCATAEMGFLPVETDAFRALSQIKGAVPMSDEELSTVEGSRLVFGSIRQPLFHTSISAYLNEILLTLLGIEGRTPIVSYTTISTYVMPLPAGGVTVSVEPNIFVLAKNFYCVGCTQP